MCEEIQYNPEPPYSIIEAALVILSQGMRLAVIAMTAQERHLQAIMRLQWMM